MEQQVNVKCFSCNSELSTTWSELTSGKRSHCPSCNTDLRPRHTDKSCLLCGGKGAFDVNGALWICGQGAAEEALRG